MKSKSILAANFLASISIIFIFILAGLSASGEIDFGPSPTAPNTSAWNFWGISALIALFFNAIVGWFTYMLKKSGGALICAIFSLYHIIVSLVLSLILLGTPVIHFGLLIFVALHTIGFFKQRAFNEDEGF